MGAVSAGAYCVTSQDICSFRKSKLQLFSAPWKLTEDPFENQI